MILKCVYRESSRFFSIFSSNECVYLCVWIFSIVNVSLKWQLEKQKTNKPTDGRKKAEQAKHSWQFRLNSLVKSGPDSIY